MILLDTCAIIWEAITPKELSKKAKAIIIKNEGMIAISSISLWEIAMLSKIGRLQLGCDSNEFLETLLKAKQYKVCEINPKIATQAVNWGESMNKDPADRIIAATSYCNKWELVTADKKLRRAEEIITVW